jgi:hypothetical protein
MNQTAHHAPDPAAAPSAAMWAKHLQPDERLIWQADTSQRLVRAEASRRRLMAVLAGLASAILAAAFGYKLYELIVVGNAQPNLSIAIGGPLYGLIALAFAAVAFAQIARLFRKPPPAFRYAATTTRLIALNAAGRIVDQVDVQDVAGLILGGRRRTPDLYALRKHDDTNVRAFAIERIEKPLEAWNIIEEHLLGVANAP